MNTSPAILALKKQSESLIENISVLRYAIGRIETLELAIKNALDKCNLGAYADAHAELTKAQSLL